MQVAFALLCDRANTTGDGKLNVIGAFDRMTAPEFPIEYPTMSLVVGLRAHSSEIDEPHRLAVRLFGQERDDIGEMVAEVTVPKPSAPSDTVRFHTILEFANATIPEPCEYEFRVYVDGDEQARVPLSISTFSARTKE